jgi:hypothetical protein
VETLSEPGLLGRCVALNVKAIEITACGGNLVVPDRAIAELKRVDVESQVSCDNDIVGKVDLFAGQGGGGDVAMLAVFGEAAVSLREDTGSSDNSDVAEIWEEDVAKVD